MRDLTRFEKLPLVWLELREATTRARLDSIKVMNFEKEHGFTQWTADEKADDQIYEEWVVLRDEAAAAQQRVSLLAMQADAEGIFPLISQIITKTNVGDLV